MVSWFLWLCIALLWSSYYGLVQGVHQIVHQVNFRVFVKNICWKQPLQGIAHLFRFNFATFQRTKWYHVVSDKSHHVAHKGFHDHFNPQILMNKLNKADKSSMCVCNPEASLTICCSCATSWDSPCDFLPLGHCTPWQPFWRGTSESTYATLCRGLYESTCETSWRSIG